MPQPSPFWLGTSWKMNGSKAMAAHYVGALKSFDWGPQADIVPFVIPPYPIVERVAEALGGTPVRVGVQNVHWAQEGPFTGEVSPTMAREMGATIAEIGHSERRALFGETDETVRARTAGALEAGLTPLICIGDTRSEQDAGAAAATIIRQTQIALSGLSPTQVERCVLAYEPVWSIGAGGTPAEPAAVSVTLAALRDALVADHGTIGSRLPLLYGGSVSLANVEALAVTPHVDGLFVGRAAWTPDGILGLITGARQARAGLHGRP